MGLTLDYRPFTSADLPELEKLWLHDTKWGGLTKQMWLDHVVNAPLGPPAGMLAVDSATGAIVGQFPFVRVLVEIDGQVRKAFRPSAPILSQRISELLQLANPFSHPVAVMYRQSIDALREEGAALLVMVPDPRWARFLRMFPGLQVGKVPLFSRPLPLTQPLEVDPEYTMAPLVNFDDRVDALWRLAGRHHGVALARTADVLQAKIGRGDWEVLGVTRSGRLVGLVASRQHGDRQWLVGDLISEDLDGALRATLRAVIELANRRATEAPEDKPIHKVCLAVTPAMQAAVTGMGFVRDNYDFALVVHQLDPAISPSSIAPGRWYISAND